MSRYIDKDILLETIEELTWYHLNEVLGKMIEGANTEGWYKSEDIYKAIDAIPTADVVENVRVSPITTATKNKPTEYVEVVRCKDCKWWDGIECQTRDIDVVDVDDYCSYGEREDGEKE